MNQLFHPPISSIGLLLLGSLSVATHAASIQGNVFLDENNNGQRDAGEPVRINAIVRIVDETLERTGQGVILAPQLTPTAIIGLLVITQVLLEFGSTFQKA
jgi:hypothetical protein